MEMFSGVSNFIKKNLSLKQQNGDISDQRSEPRPDDRLEDGFLLVGDTASERNTVYASRYTPYQMDRPPRYTEVSQNGGLPSYTDYQSQSQLYSPTVDNSDFRYGGNPFQTGMPTTLTGASSSSGLQYENPTQTGLTNSTPGVASEGETSYKSAIADVPFTLGASTNMYSSVNELRKSELLKQQLFDHNCYEYDFSLETRFLSEYCDYNGNAKMEC